MEIIVEVVSWIQGFQGGFLKYGKIWYGNKIKSTISPEKIISTLLKIMTSFFVNIIKILQYIHFISLM